MAKQQLQNNCELCKKRGGMATRKFYEGEHWWAALDGNPISPGNSLLISKKPFKTIIEAAPEVLEELGTALRIVSRALKRYFNQAASKSFKKYSEAGLIGKDRHGTICNIFILSLGEGENTQHLHFHLVPYFSSQRKERGKVKGKIMSWLGQRELMRDGSRERASLLGVDNRFYDKISNSLDLKKTANSLREFMGSRR